MLVSHTHKFVFIHVPKTGGTSIRHALQDAVPDFTPYQRHVPRHPTALTGRDALGALWAHYLTFAFVRNPWERAVSFYLEKVQATHTSFEDFLTIGHSWCDPQVNYLHDRDGTCLVKCIGRFERLNDDVARVCATLGISLVLPHLNRTEHIHYRAYYNDHTRQLVATAFQADLAAFGYQF
jgi:hypothetical protein